MATQKATSTKGSKDSKKPTKAQLAAAAKMGLTEEPTPVLTAPPAAKSAMDFAVQQLSAPQAPAIPPAAQGAPSITDTPEFQAALAAALAKQNKTVAPKAPRPEKISQNGISRPAPGTKCDTVWSAADEITAKIGSPAPVVLLKAALPGFNDHTIKTQYARWRQFNGISGRVGVPVGAPEALQEAKAAEDDESVVQNRRATDKA